MKPVHWIGSSLRVLRLFPEEVRQEAGYSIYLAQMGEKAANAVPMLGFGGANVVEVVINNEGDTFRAIYTVRFEKAIYVLHSFQKKSKRGSATRTADIRLIKRRLKVAEGHYKESYQSTKTTEPGHEQGA